MTRGNMAGHGSFARVHPLPDWAREMNERQCSEAYVADVRRARLLPETPLPRLPDLKEGR